MTATDTDDDTIEWPEPQDDPDEEPSHPGAEDDAAET